MNDDQCMPSSPGPDASDRHVRLRLLRNRSFAFLWSADIISAVGDQFYNLALMWYVLRITGSVLATGLVPAFGFLAQVSLGLVAGALADRWPRKRIMILADTTRACVVLGIGSLALAGAISLWQIYASSFLLTAARLFFGPARSAALPEIVGGESLVQANALMSTTRRSVALAGTALGAAAIVIVGPVLAILANGISFAISALCVAQATFPPSVASRRAALNLQMIVGDVWAGLKFVAHSAILRQLIAVAVVANFGGGLTAGLLPVLAQRQLHGSTKVYGALVTALAIGQLLGSLLMVGRGKRLPLGQSVIWSLFATGAAYVAIAVARLWPLAAVLLGVDGFTSAVANIPIGTLLQLSAPSEARGRVITAFSVLVNLGSPAGVAIGAFGAARLGLPPIYVLAGILIAAGGFWGWTRSALRRA